MSLALLVARLAKISHSLIVRPHSGPVVLAGAKIYAVVDIRVGVNHLALKISRNTFGDFTAMHMPVRTPVPWNHVHVSVAYHVHIAHS